MEIKDNNKTDITVKPDDHIEDTYSSNLIEERINRENYKHGWEKKVTIEHGSFIIGSSCYYDNPEKHKVFCGLSNKVAKMILNMQDKDRIQEIAFLIRQSYDSYVAAETENDPIETLKEEWSIK